MADWKVGDLALCVTHLNPDPFRSGQVHTVIAVFPETSTDWPALLFKGLPAPDAGNGWLQSCFRKITPGADIEGFEEPRRIPVKEKA